MTTVQNIFDDALIDLGKHTPGDTVDPVHYAYMLSSLNRFVSGLSNHLHLVTKATEVSFPLTGVLDYTIGVGATINSARPIKLLSAYLSINQVLHELQIAQSEADFGRMFQIKNLGGWASCIYLDNAFPIATLKVYPKMSDANCIIHYQAPMTGFTAISNTVEFPPGYEDLLWSNMAVRAASAFGVTASNDTKEIAANSLRTIKRINAEIPKLKSEYAMMSGSSYQNSGYGFGGVGGQQLSFIPLIVSI